MHAASVSQRKINCCREEGIREKYVYNFDMLPYQGVVSPRGFRVWVLWVQKVLSKTFRLNERLILAFECLMYLLYDNWKV